MPLPSLTRPDEATLPPLPRRVAVFDLDRTLLPGSSLMDLARVLADDGLLRRRTVVRHVAVNASFTKRGADDSRVDRIRGAALRAATGWDHARFARAAESAAQTAAARTSPGARWLLDRHGDAGDFCVILSAAPQELVDAISVRLGAHRAVGTRGAVVDGRLTGELDGPFCYGPGKLTRLAAEVGPVDLDQACAYADSASDLPVLLACGHPVAVNPDRRLERIAAQRHWPVLHVA